MSGVGQFFHGLFAPKPTALRLWMPDKTDRTREGMVGLHLSEAEILEEVRSNFSLTPTDGVQPRFVLTGPREQSTPDRPDLADVEIVYAPGGATFIRPKE